MRLARPNAGAASRDRTWDQVADTGAKWRARHAAADFWVANDLGILILISAGLFSPVPVSDTCFEEAIHDRSRSVRSDA